MDVEDLELTGIIAFDGVTKNGLLLHPDQEHLIYPMGNKVSIKNIASGKQNFLTGHTNLISALCVSSCGKFIGSGQINHLGFKAMVIVWDYEERQIKGSHEIHKVRVEDVCFSCKSNYLISLGGRDDGNVVIWDIRSNDAICGSFASSETAGNAYTVIRTNVRDRCFVTGGDRTLKVWRINRETRKVYGVDVKVGKLRRSINCIVIDERDENAYCGTSTGDIIRARLNYHHSTEHMELVQTPIMIGCYSKIPTNLKRLKAGEGDLYAGGIQNLLLLSNGQLVVGAGDGTVELTEILHIETGNRLVTKMKLPIIPRIQTLLTENVRSTVTSMALLRNEYILVGTLLCEIYQIKLLDFNMRLLVTSHTDTIYDVAFPHNYSEVFATSSKNDIRIWRLETQKELLRITVPNMVCSGICFSYDGKMIVSAWNDGMIRTFTPQSGQLIFAIHNAHVKAVSAVCITMDGTKLISGGCDGQVRLWDIKPDVQRLVGVLKEHRGPVTSLHISYNNEEVISASTDGTCIVWNIVLCSRKQVLMGNTMYMAARFSPNGVQLLTCGTDRKIAYWETLNGSLVREVEGSNAGALNCLDVSSDGQYFVTGSNDCIVKIWGYHMANTTHIGMGHAAIITACKFSPDSKYIVTVSADGAIMIWKCPFIPKFDNTFAESVRSKSTCSVREVEWQKLRLHKLKDDLENIAGMTPKSEATDSIETIHKSVARRQCKCSPTESTRNVHRYKGEQKVPISEQGSVNESIRSKKSTTLISLKSNKAGTTLNSTKLRSEEKHGVQCVPSNSSTVSLGSADKIQATATSNRLPMVSKTRPRENYASPSIKSINRSSPSTRSSSTSYNMRKLKNALITNTCTEK